MAPRRTLAADSTTPHPFKVSEGPSFHCTTCGRGKGSPVHHSASSPGASSPNPQPPLPSTTTPHAQAHNHTAPKRASAMAPSRTPGSKQCSSLCSRTGSGIRCPADPPCHVVVHFTSEQRAFYMHTPLYKRPLKWLGYYCTSCEYVHSLADCCIQPNPNHMLLHVASDAVAWPPPGHLSHYELGECPLTRSGGVSCASPKL